MVWRRWPHRTQKANRGVEVQSKAVPPPHSKEPTAASRFNPKRCPHRTPKSQPWRRGSIQSGASTALQKANRGALPGPCNQSPRSSKPAASRAARRKVRVAGGRRRQRLGFCGYAEEAFEVSALAFRAFDFFTVEHEGLEVVLAFLTGILVHRHGKPSSRYVRRLR
jgi:hypothetical protein